MATLNLIRKQGQTSTLNVAGTGSFDANPGNVYDIWFGIDATNDSAQPYGPHITYKVPCEETVTVERSVVDDSLATELDVQAFDPNDGNIITLADPVDLDAAQTYIIPMEWWGDSEEDFGNRFCEDEEGMGNLMVIRYNATCYDEMYPIDENGNKYPRANVPINLVLTSAAGMTDATFEVPVLRSTAKFRPSLYVDTDDTYDPDSGNGGNITAYLYDVNWYIDNDVNPPQVKCGYFDEDNQETGADAADSYLFYVTNETAI